MPSYRWINGVLPLGFAALMAFGCSHTQANRDAKPVPRETKPASFFASIDEFWIDLDLDLTSEVRREDDDLLVWLGGLESGIAFTAVIDKRSGNSVFVRTGAPEDTAVDARQLENLQLQLTLLESAVHAFASRNY